MKTMQQILFFIAIGSTLTALTSGSLKTTVKKAFLEDDGDAFDAFSTNINAKNYMEQRYAIMDSSCIPYSPVMDVLQAQDAVLVYNLNFSSQAASFYIEAAADYDAGVTTDIALHLDSIGSTPFAKVTISDTEGVTDFLPFVAPVLQAPQLGVHRVYLTFNSNSPGSPIVRLRMLHFNAFSGDDDGVAYDAFSTNINAKNYMEQRYAVMDDSCTPYLPVIDVLQARDAVLVYNLNFSTQAASFYIEAAADYDAGVVTEIALHLDNIGSTPFANVTISDTGGATSFLPFVAPVLQAPLLGVHRVYLTFQSNSPDSPIVRLRMLHFNAFSGDDDGVAYDAFSTSTNAMYYMEQRYAMIDDSCISSQHYIKVVQADDAVLVYNFDFSGPAASFYIEAATEYDVDVVTEISLHLDSIESSPFAYLIISDTGGATSFLPFVAPVLQSPELGVHRVYLTFQSNYANSPIVRFHMLRFIA